MILSISMISNNYLARGAPGLEPTRNIMLNEHDYEDRVWLWYKKLNATSRRFWPQYFCLFFIVPILFVSIIMNTKCFIYCMEVSIWWWQYCKIHANSWQKVFGKLQNSLFFHMKVAEGVCGWGGFKKIITYQFSF